MMTFVMPNFMPAFPEIIVLGMGCLILLISTFIKKPKSLTLWLVQLTLLGAAFLTLWLYDSPLTITFDGMFVLDKLASLLKLFIYMSVFMTFAYSASYVRERDIPEPEYYLLGLFSVLGMMILVSGESFLTLFLGLELFSLPVYTMVALRRNLPVCSEAAIKYFIIGALASGMLLYGLSMLYGFSGSLDISRVADVVAQASPMRQIVLLFALVFVIAGVSFKLGAVPFHMWVPDVYEGAPTSVTLFISAAPKIAGLGLAFRLLVDAVPGLHIPWQQMLIVISILSMAIGNIVAIAQSNLKRMLAYSSIAHVGYVLLGLLAATPNGYAAALFYMITYAITTLGAFGMVVLLSKGGFEAEEIDDLRGLNTRSPWLAFMMLLLMFSMAGVPPTVGFIAKLGVLEALIDVHLVWLATLALLFAIIGAYYYIRVVKVMYFEEPLVSSPAVCTPNMFFAITLNCLAVLVLGIFPGALFTLCRIAF